MYRIVVNVHKTSQYKFCVNFFLFDWENYDNLDSFAFFDAFKKVTLEYNDLHGYIEKWCYLGKGTIRLTLLKGNERKF